jgi:polyisoprenoid-binding protein YceI
VITITTVAAGTWTVEAGTRVGFAARNFGVNTVRGTITVTGGAVEIGADGRPVRLSGTLDPGSVDTGNGRRDKDLRGARFLDVARHPAIEVVADRVEPAGHGWRARAAVTVRGIQCPLWIDAALDERSTASRLWVTGTARLDLWAVGIRVPRLMVGRWVELTFSACLT